MENWKQKWKVESSNLGGGQGDCFIVTPTGEFPDGLYFLKTLKDQKNTERRRRFYIETTIYQSVEINGIPKIIETNSDRFLDKDVLLYYVSEYIDGIRLDEYVSKNGISEFDILKLFRQLLEILLKCHPCQVLHRDIKPENIIITDNGLYLVDFGLSYFDIEGLDNTTKIGQEIGNRFLRLPEYAAGSFNKRDSRSDLTLAIGIALYLITGEYPRTLVNESGNYPHQQEGVPEEIKNLKNARFWNLLFDKGFQSNLERRWTSASEILDVIDLMENDNSDSGKFEDLLKQYASQIDHGYLIELENGLKMVYQELDHLIKVTIAEKAPGFYTEQQRWVYSSGSTERKAETSVYAIGKGKAQRLPILFKAVLVGSQVVAVLEVGGNEHEVARLKLGDSISDDEFLLVKTKIESIILPGIADLIS